MRPVSILLLALLLACLYQVAEALEEGAIAEPSMPVPNMNMPAPRVTQPITGLDAQKTSSKSSEKKSSINEPEEAADPINGKWTMRFSNLMDRSIDMTLWSSGKDKIMGFATMTKAGSDVSMTASGSKSGKELTMVIKSAQVELASPDYSQYDLDLVVENSTLSGTYILSTGTGDSLSGNVTAIKR